LRIAARKDVSSLRVRGNMGVIAPVPMFSAEIARSSA
jgi:hypothetical protein